MERFKRNNLEGFRRQHRRIWRGKRFSVYKPVTPGEVVAGIVGAYFGDARMGWCNSGAAVGGYVDPVALQ